MAAFLLRKMQKAGLRKWSLRKVRGFTFKSHPFRTLSSLFATFNHLSFGRRQDNRSADSLGLFGIPELSSHKGFEILRDRAVKDGRAYVGKAMKCKSTTEMVEIFDNLSDSLCRVADLAEFVRLTHPDEKYRKAAENASLSLSSFVEKLNTNVELYNALKRALTSDSDEIDSVTEKVGELFLFDFEESGIHLDAKRRSEFVKLQEEILILGGQFAQGTITPVYISADNWAPCLKHGFQTFRDLIIVDGLCPNSQDPSLREAAYCTYLKPMNSQLETLDKLLTARYKLAKLVGYRSFAERSLNPTMGGNPQTVNNFLEKTASMLYTPAKKELSILKSMKDFETRTSSEIYAWDVQYYTGQAKSQTLQLNSTSLSAYFSIGSCMEGLNMIFDSLYNILLEPVEAGKGELWSHDVQKLAVTHQKEGILGYIYCDFFSRSDKLQQDCHFTIQGGRLMSNGNYQLPIVALVCNFPEPTLDKPSLLTHGMVENLFHEMGHAMHSMLARTRYQHITGTRCSTDFAEVPSILMEYFVWDSRILSSFARHYRTGQVLPDEMIEKLCLSRHMFSALEMQTQVLYALIDQRFHGEHPLGKTTTEILEEFQNKYTAIPFVSGTAWHQRFSHLHGYGARYYSYLLSRAVASQIWHKCFEKDPLSRDMGERYRQRMLAHGGGKDPKILVENMLEQKLSLNDLVESLEHDIVKGKPFPS